MYNNIYCTLFQFFPQYSSYTFHYGKFFYVTNNDDKIMECTDQQFLFKLFEFTYHQLIPTFWPQKVLKQHNYIFTNDVLFRLYQCRPGDFKLCIIFLFSNHHFMNNCIFNAVVGFYFVPFIYMYRTGIWQILHKCDIDCTAVESVCQISRQQNPTKKINIEGHFIVQ